MSAGNCDGIVDIRKSLTKAVATKDLVEFQKNLQLNKPVYDKIDYLEPHRQKRKEFNLKYDRLQETGELWNYENTLRQLKEQPIKCMKYNYSLDAEIQNSLQFESIITVSEDGKKLKLINKKPVEDTIHVLEADPHSVKK